MSTQTHASNAASGIPIVDFAPYLDPTTPSDVRIQVGRDIFAAFRDIGFVHLTGHGIGKDVIEKVFSTSKEFFSLPLEEKMLAPHPPETWYFRGYSHVGREKVSLYPDATNTGKSPSTPSAPVNEVRESFDIGRPSCPFTPNIWPPSHIAPELKPTLSSFFNQTHELAMKILSALALGMELSAGEDYFRKFHGNEKEGPLNQLRLLHYPAVDAGQLLNEGEENTTRIVPHTDKGTMTLLWQDSVGGLQVQHAESRSASGNDGDGYIDVPVIPDAVLVNIGDLLQMWSNDVLRSTRHRVGLPPRNKKGEGWKKGDMVDDRYSVVVFVAPDLDAVVDSLDGCSGVEGKFVQNRPKEERGKKYAEGGMKAWDYIVKSTVGAY